MHTLKEGTNGRGLIINLPDLLGMNGRGNEGVTSLYSEVNPKGSENGLFLILQGWKPTGTSIAGFP